MKAAIIVSCMGLGLAAVLLFGGCTTFGRISWLNTKILLRPPDAVPNRMTSPARAEARLAALWVGHATVLVQMDDKFILTDPVTRFIGGISARLVEPGLAPEHLPKLTAALVSHRHFDHLSKGSFRLIEAFTPAVLTPPGAGADVPHGSYKVRELVAWQSWEHDGLRITAVPAKHVGGRLIGDEVSHAHAFAGYMMEYRGLVVYFAGDTCFDGDMFGEIAKQFPAVDLALMPIGPLKPAAEMQPHHLNPAEAFAAAEILGARYMLPIHYGTFINSLDRPGEVEAAFVHAAGTRTSFRTESSLLPIGGQRIFSVGVP